MGSPPGKQPSDDHPFAWLNAEPTGANHGEAGALCRALIEVAPDGIVCADAAGRIVMLNSQAERMFQYSRAELMGLPVESLLPERHRTTHLIHRRHYATTPRTRPMGIGLDLVGRRSDGSEFPVEISLSPLDTEHGLLITAIIRDVTERRQAEQERLQLLERERRRSEQLRLSVREAHHRIKNNLQAVSDLLYFELTVAGEPSAQEALRESIDRIRAIATIHDLLSQDEDVRVVDSRAAVERLLPMILASAGPSDAEILLSTDVQPVPLSSKRATILALILNELVTNAVKHAFPPGSSGSLSVTLQQEAEELVLRVTDDGPGLPVDFALDTHSNVGLDVVRTLAERDLNGSFRLHQNDGVAAEVRFVW